MSNQKFLVTYNAESGENLLTVVTALDADDARQKVQRNFVVVKVEPYRPGRYETGIPKTTAE